MNYYFAPMEGITGAVFRRTHHEFFPGIDKYFMPFITPTTQEKLTPRQKRDVLPEYNEGVPAVPQLLTRTAADFIWAANTLASLGYAEVNLNLGCPSGTVTAKGKGAGFLAHPDELDRCRFLRLHGSDLHQDTARRTRSGGIRGAARDLQPLSRCGAYHSSARAAGLLQGPRPRGRLRRRAAALPHAGLL